MEVQFRDAKFDQLEIDPRYEAGFSQSVVTAFRRRMQMIRAAPDERVFYQSATSGKAGGLQKVEPLQAVRV